MDRLKKLKEKKEAHEMHPLAKKAKMGVMHEMQKMAQGAMGDKLKGMGKVTVASNSPQGLEHGLDKAKNALHNLPEAFDDSHTDHENFAHTMNRKDGNDGMNSFPDADDAHQLEADPMAQHAQDEHEEGYAEGGEIAVDDGTDTEDYPTEDGIPFAEGGEVDVNDTETEEQRDEHGEMPNYDDMDRGEMSAHLEMLVKAMRKNGMA